MCAVRWRSRRKTGSVSTSISSHASGDREDPVSARAARTFKSAPLAASAFANSLICVDAPLQPVTRMPRSAQRYAILTLGNSALVESARSVLQTEERARATGDAAEAPEIHRER